MNAFALYLATLHQQDLLSEAERMRRIKVASAARPAAVPAWRRGLGGLFASAARSIDPSIGGGRVVRRAA